MGSFNMDTSFNLLSNGTLDAIQRASTGGWFKRHVATRVIALGVSVTAAADAVTHLCLAGGKLVVGSALGAKGLVTSKPKPSRFAWFKKEQPRTLSNWTVKQSAIHVVKALGLIVAAVINIAAAILSPTSLTVKGFEKCGLAQRTHVQLGKFARVKAAFKAAMPTKLPRPGKRTVIVALVLAGVYGAHRMGYVNALAPVDFLSAQWSKRFGTQEPAKQNLQTDATPQQNDGAEAPQTDATPQQNDGAEAPRTDATPQQTGTEALDGNGQQ